jgi:hypothetical protein
MLSSAVTAAFMLLLMALAILTGVYIFIYASHRFFVIVQETAAGVDEVQYPALPLLDKLPRAAYLAGLLAICLVPAGFFLKLNPEIALGGSPLLTFFVAATIFLWLLFPVALLSALSASSPWVVFRWTVLRFLLRHAAATIVFYAVSAVLAASSFGLLYLGFARDSWLFSHDSWLFTLAAPIAIAAAFLIYARLLGRVAYLFDHLPRGGRGRRRLPGTKAVDPWGEPEEPSSGRKKAKRANATRGKDPWAPREAEAPKKKKRAEGVHGYGIADDETNPAAVDQPPTKPTRRVKGYRLADEPLPALPKELPQDGYVPVGYEPIPTKQRDEGEGASHRAPDIGMASDFARRYGQRVDDTPQPPARPLLSGVYSFPWYPANWPVWLVLALGGDATCALIHVCARLKEQLGT